MRRVTDLTGLVFGRLTVLAKAAVDKNGSYFWSCECSCGGRIVTRGSSLKRGHTRSCGCLLEEHNAKPRARAYASVEDATWAQKLRVYWHNATKHGFSFNLSMERFREVCGKPCHYCGEPPELRPATRGRVAIRASGIDRVDNARGYEDDNIVPCCTWCNRAKNDLEAKVFLAHCRRVAEKANAAIARNEKP